MGRISWLQEKCCFLIHALLEKSIVLLCSSIKSFPPGQQLSLHRMVNNYMRLIILTRQLCCRWCRNEKSERYCLITDKNRLDYHYVFNIPFKMQIHSIIIELSLFLHLSFLAYLNWFWVCCPLNMLCVLWPLQRLNHLRFAVKHMGNKQLSRA